MNVLVMDDGLTDHIDSNMFLLNSYIKDHHHLWKEHNDEDSKHRQFVPYVTIKKQPNTFALFLNNGHYTIGLGNHILQRDSIGNNVLAIVDTAMIRNLGDYINLSDVFCNSIQFLTMKEIIRLNTTQFDRSHLGIWYSCIVELGTTIETISPELEFVGWKNLEELKTYDLNMWSSYIVECLENDHR